MPNDVEVTPASPTIEMAPGLPFGLVIIGTAFSEFKLISYAYAFEQATQTRLKRMAYPEAIPKTQLKDVIMERDGAVRVL
jgi:amidase